MEANRKCAESGGITITGVAAPGGESLNLFFPHGEKSLLEGNLDFRPEDLLVSLEAESEFHVSAIASSEPVEIQRRLRWTSLSGLKPVLFLTERLPRWLRGERLFSFLGLENAALSLYLREGKPRCSKPQCDVEKVDLSKLASDVLKDSGESLIPARSVLLGRVISVEKHKKAKKIGVSEVEAVLVTLALSGIRRTYINEKYFRLDDSLPHVNGVLSPAQKEDLLGIVSATSGPIEIFSVAEALSIARLTAEELVKRIEAELQSSSELEIIIQHETRGAADSLPELGARRKAVLGFYCKRCKKTLPPVTPASLLTSTIEFEGILYDEFFNRSGNTLAASAVPFRETLEHLRIAGLGDIPLNRRLGELSTGERLLFSRFLPVCLGYQDVLILGSSGKTKLDVAQEESLEALDSLLLRGRNTLILENESDRTSSEKHELTLFVQSSGKLDRMLPVGNEELPLGAVSVLAGGTASGKSRSLRKINEILNSQRKGRGKTGGKCEYGDAETILDRARSSGTASSGSALLSVAKVLDLAAPLAELFASLPEARRRGVDVKQLRIDIAENCCPLCRGLGKLRDTHTPPEFWPLCPECLGLRFSANILDVKFFSRSLADVMTFTVADALTFFQHHDALAGTLHQAALMGLSSVMLGAVASFETTSVQLRLYLANVFARALGGKAKAENTVLLFDEFADALDETALNFVLEVAIVFAESGGSAIFSARDEARLLKTLARAKVRPFRLKLE